MLGIYLIAITTGWILIIRWLIAIIMFVFWILSLIGVLSKEEKPIPILENIFKIGLNNYREERNS